MSACRYECPFRQKAWADEASCLPLLLTDVVCVRDDFSVHPLPTPHVCYLALFH